jgi:VanZ family protein
VSTGTRQVVVRRGGRLAWGAFTLAVVVNLVALYLPRVGGEELFPGVDKVVHLSIFAAVALTGRWVGLPAWPLGAVLVVHAVESELVQHFWLPHRDGDPADAMADTLGVLVGLLLAALLARRAVRPRSGREAPRGR